MTLWFRDDQPESSSANAGDTSSTPLDRIVSRAVTSGQALSKPITLARGQATIPLVGIDVPFHSSLLRPGVASYRAFLQGRVREAEVRPDALEGKFVPNVMGKPLALTREYVEDVARLTQSPVLQEMLETELKVEG